MDDFESGLRSHMDNACLIGRIMMNCDIDDIKDGRFRKFIITFDHRSKGDNEVVIFNLVLKENKDDNL